jgi:amino acid transporter
LLTIINSIFVGDVVLEKEVFIRKASGLVRPYGALDVTLIYTLIIFAILNTTLQLAWFHGFWPGADLPIGCLVGLIPTLLVAFAYWAIAVSMPRSGCDYVWFARVTHPAIGFGWSLVYFYMYLCAAFVTICFTYGYTISMALVAWGMLYNAPNLVSIGTWLQSTTGSFVFALVIMIIYCILNILGYKIAKAILYAGWIIQAIALIAMWYILGSITPTTFAAKWDSLMSNYVTYDGVFKLSESAGWSFTPISFGPTFSSVAFTFMLLSGAAFGAGTISGEVRDVSKSVPIGLILSNLFSCAIWSICDITLLHATSYKWFSAISWLWASGSAEYPLPFPPSMPLMIGIAAYPNTSIGLLALTTFVLANIAFPYVTLMTAARYWFAWGFDRLMPTKLAEVSTRFKTPHYAIIVTTIIAIISGFLFAFLGFANWFAAVSTVMVLCYAVIALSVAIFPYTKWRTLLDTLPKFMRARIAGVPAITIISAVGAIILFYAAYAVSVNPLLTANANLAAILFGSIFVGGIILYYIGKAYWAKKGIDITLGFKEIPPA